MGKTWGGKKWEPEGTGKQQPAARLIPIFYLPFFTCIRVCLRLTYRKNERCGELRVRSTQLILVFGVSGDRGSCGGSYFVILLFLLLSGYFARAMRPPGKVGLQVRLESTICHLPSQWSMILPHIRRRWLQR